MKPSKPETLAVPIVQLGYIQPTRVGDAIAWQFHQSCPPGMMLVAYPINLGAFSSHGVETALDALWPAHEFLVSRGVDRIVQGGIPVSAIMGRDWTLRFLEQARERSTIPVDADFEESIAGLRALGCHRIAMASKWDGEVMEVVGNYLRHAGLEPLGWASQAHTAPEVMQVNPRQGHEMAMALGREALRANPSADALLLAGGAWISSVAVPLLEQEFGRPVVTNPSATWWAAMKQAGLRPTRRGHGCLIDSLFD